MRVVIGGAYNGKRKYVKEQLVNIPEKQCHFYEGIIPKNVNFTKEDVIVIGNFEKVIQNYIHLDELEIATVLFQDLQLLDLQANVICICTDIGRGIVPIDKDNRKLRDTCGRFYQKLFAESESVVRVWYGIPKILKDKE